MSLINLTNNAKDAFRRAVHIARRKDSRNIISRLSTLHLLYGLVQSGTVAGEALAASDAVPHMNARYYPSVFEDYEDPPRYMSRYIHQLSPSELLGKDVCHPSAELGLVLHDVLMSAHYREYDLMPHNQVGTEHLLVAILRRPDCGAVRWLASLHVSSDSVLAAVSNLLNEVISPVCPLRDVRAFTKAVSDPNVVTAINALLSNIRALEDQVALLRRR